MFFMIVVRRSVTSARLQLRPILFWLISSPETATPPALAALEGGCYGPAGRSTGRVRCAS